MIRRNAILGLAALLAATGCNAGTANGLRRSEPPVAKETITMGRIIEQHNKNAEMIQSLRANPSIELAAEDDKGKRSHFKLSGRMAVERERDFRLQIFAGMSSQKQADIGSNTQGFWFWVKENPERRIYTCDYENVSASPMTVTMQPDWIMEAMGLREISDREVHTINATKGDRPGLLVLTQLRPDSKGGSYTKVTIVDETTGEIREHRLYAGAKEKLLAKATVIETGHIKLLETGEMVSFPARLQLEWVVEKFSLDITMSGLKINPAFDQAARAEFFTEPKVPGAVRTDLARMYNAAAGSGSSRIQESSPRSGIRLLNPESEPTGVDGASFDQGSRAPIAADLAILPPMPSEYVGPQVPTAPETESVRSTAMPGYGRGTFRQ